MAKSARIVPASGLSNDALTGQPIPSGTPVAFIEWNSRCSTYLTAEQLRRLADEIDAGPGLLFENGHTPNEQQRWR